MAVNLLKIPTLGKLGDIRGQKVLLRADFNVPQDDAGNITSDLRIQASMPTINWLLDKGAKLIMMSHLGRPKGKGVEPEFSLKPVAKRLSDLLGFDVKLLPDCVGEQVRGAVNQLVAGKAVLLENVRFHAEEQKGDETFGRQLSQLAEFYVNDAFGTCHRGDASMTWPARLLRSCAGELVRAEIEAMAKVLENPARPMLAIVGGAKVKDKLPLLNNLLGRVNEVCIGGGMAYTFLKSRGVKIGKSLLDEGSLKLAEQVLLKARELDVVIHLPTDHVCAKSLDDETAHRVIGDIPDDQAGFDIGDQTARTFTASIARAKTLLFNGPVGVFEKERFSNGTKAIVSAIADATLKGAYSVVGGGDSAAAVEAFNMADKMSHVSTGGGASLTLLEGGAMPGLEALVR